MNIQQAILALAPPHIARARVPLIGATSPWHSVPRDAHGIIVWDGASETTIYGDARINHAFRAWHDACHLSARAGFTLAGERHACNAQIAELLARYPSAPQSAIGLIRAEVIGQAEHFAAHGFFPVDQSAFISDYIRGHQ